MRTVAVGNSPLTVSRLAYGCWRLAGTSDPTQVTSEARAAGKRALVTAFECGFTLFDTADIYCGGEVERMIGDTLREVSWMRERVAICTKACIRRQDDPGPGAPHRWDFSAQYLVNCCEQSLMRLGVETIDIFMLHRPDYLADPHEVALAFTQLRDSGKVRQFGVSNFRPTLLTAIRSACPMPIITHQIEVSLLQIKPFTDGTLDQCLTDKVTPMAWSPLGGGLLGDGSKTLATSTKKARAAKMLPVIDEIAQQRGVSRTAVALAWLLRHPSGIVPIVGSNNPEHIREAARATDFDMMREEWYRLLKAATLKELP